jgi:hypothetical protein
MNYAKTCPMTYDAIVETYFLEHRAKLIDIAAFLDRLERAEEGAAEREDFRVAALREAIAVLSDGKGERAKRVLDLFSDPSEALPQSAAGTKGALGAAPEATP